MEVSVSLMQRFRGAAGQEMPCFIEPESSRMVLQVPQSEPIESNCQLPYPFSSSLLLILSSHLILDAIQMVYLSFSNLSFYVFLVSPMRVARSSVSSFLISAS
jgi:hypothetical protein